MSDRRCWRVSHAALATVLGMVAGCGGPALPPPGASQALLHLWRPGVEGPVEIFCGKVEQDRENLHLFQVGRVRVRIPLREGALLVDARTGSFDSRQGGRLELDEPVQIQGRLDGYPLVGRARAASISGAERDLVLDAVELVHRGQALRAERVRIPESWAAAWTVDGALRSAPASPLVGSALGALPAGLEIPHLNRSADPRP